MLMNRRSEPDSSHTLARNPGYLESRLSRTSLIVAASTSTVSAPDVNFRNGVGMTTLSDMISTPKYGFECRKLRLDHLRRSQVERIECLQAVSRDREHGQIGLLDPALRHQLLSHGYSYTAGCFREYTFRFGKQLDTRNNLCVCTILSPSAGLGNQSGCEVTVRGISDG